MATIQSAHNAVVDGMVRSARSSGMSVEQMRQAGQTMLGTLREAQAANPLLAEYFPGLGQWATALSGALETALADLTREVPADVSARVRGAFQGVVGNDRNGQPVEIGPLLRGELIDLVQDQGASDADLRAHVLASQEVGDTRRALVEGAYNELLGRGSTLAERNELSTFIDQRLAAGASLADIDREVQQRVNGSSEKALLERVGMVFWQAFPEHEAPKMFTKRSWTDSVMQAMAMGMPEAMALQVMAQQLRSGS